ncbi:MAG: class I SAM-dependent RNA methyltransferase [Rhodocyclaceae bacterium]|nr:class I SAM-dependent RNA methyltransferase [Rhodocyclaceae bacterium]
MANNQYFATCPRGLEMLLAEDLAGVGAEEVRTVPGGAHFTGDWRCCYRANLETRIAIRILWRVGHGRYKGEEDIFRLALSLSWQNWFEVNRTLRVYVTAIKSPLRSLEFTTLRIKDAVCDRFREATGSRPSIDTARPDVRIHAFLTAEEVTLYLDTSGDPLYKRGFKRASVEAPLKENLAAGILRLAGWKPGIPLLDPMCGSGTFLLEAAQMALDIAPGLARGFAFEKLKNFQNGQWHRVKGEAEARRKPVEPLPLYGSDLYGEEVARARQNLAAAGLEGAVTLKQADVLEISPPAESGILVANPPYGVRIQSRVGMDQFYPKLGDALKKRFAGWNCHFISADADLAKLIGLKASRKTPLYNGDLECRLYEYRMVSGQNRGKLDCGVD